MEPPPHQNVGSWSSSSAREPVEGAVGNTASESKEPTRAKLSFHVNNTGAASRGVGKGARVVRQQPHPPARGLGTVFGEPEDEEEVMDASLLPPTNASTHRSNRGEGKAQKLGPEGKKQRAAELKEKGNTLAETGSFGDALRVWEEALSLTPADATLWELKAQGHMQLEEWVDAIESGRKATEMAPDWLDAKLTLGRAYMSFGEIQLALTTFAEVCGRDPGNEEARQDLMYAGQVSMELKRRVDDLELQLTGRAGLSEDELQVAQCKVNLLQRGKVVDSDCTLRKVGEEDEEDDEMGDLDGDMMRL